MVIRSAEQVARRAIVMGAVAYRATLEISDHTRAPEVCSFVVPWLAKHGIVDDIDPCERDILLTQHGKLDESQTLDANWSGEGAAFFGWMLGVLPEPPLLLHADQGAAISACQILHRDPPDLLRTPKLPGKDEVLAICKQVILTSLTLREAHIRECGFDQENEQIALSATRRLMLAPLVGVDINELDFERARQLSGGLTQDQRRAAQGLYFCRNIAATWLIDGRHQYFGTASE